MIGPAGTVGLHVTSTQREAAVRREGRCKQSCPHPFHAFSRHALLI